jgi:thiamine biosynthesis lipoprotein
MRKVAPIMGMPISVDIPNCSDVYLFNDVFAELRRIDEQFSPFKPDSELSRFRRGELPVEQVSIGMQDIMKACLEAEAYTNGYFSARYGGEFDPSGYVKGWAIEQASNIIKQRGYSTFCIRAGGDIDAKSDGPKTWRIGIQDPRDKMSTIEQVAGKNFAVATSGNYERGNHIINPKTGQPAKELLSLTIIGPDISRADILATAAYVMGKKGLGFITKKEPGYEVLAIDKAGQVMMSKGIDRFLAV